MPAPSPTLDDLRLLDPDGSFVERLAADRLAIMKLIDNGRPQELGPLVHRLAGAAGTFGFAEIGDLAITLDDATAAGRPITAVAAARLAATIDCGLKNHERSA
jgi:HPt (histidine-containing phosphotransfer) domain-containing protein